MDRNTLGAHFIKGNFAAPNDVDQDAVNLDGLHLANNFDYVVSEKDVWTKREIIQQFTDKSRFN